MSDIIERSEVHATFVIERSYAVKPDRDGTLLTYTEQGVHYDGLDSVEGREEGTRGLLENLGSFLVSRD